MRELTIVGGGLAGLALGIALRKRDVAVKICEAGTYPRHRVCGEFINGVSSETLESLGVGEAFTTARRHHTTRWFSGNELLYEAQLPAPALGVSRHVLDEVLAKQFVDLGGDLRTGCRRKRTAKEGVIWTAGRKLSRESSWLGLKVHVKGSEMSADLEMHLGAQGYVGLAPVEDGAVNVCGLFRRQDLTGRGVELLWRYLAQNGLESLAGRLEQCEADERSFTGVSAFRLGRQEVDETECVLGDAESMIPPFTGNGMSMAFEAAETAITPMIEYAEGRFVWPTAVAELRGRLKDRFRRRLTAAQVIHPLLFSPFGRMTLAASARSGVLPFRPLARLLR